MQGEEMRAERVRIIALSRTRQLSEAAATLRIESDLTIAVYEDAPLDFVLEESAVDFPFAYAAGEQYFPQEMAQTRYYHPTNRGLEGKIGKKMEQLKKWDEEARNKKPD